MGWRRKRSKGSRDNPVAGAFVIKRGGGGGDIPIKKLEPHVARERRAHNKQLSQETKESKEARMSAAVYQAGIKARKRKEEQRRAARRMRAALARKSGGVDWIVDAHENNPGMMAIIHRDTNLEGYLNEA